MVKNAIIMIVVCMIILSASCICAYIMHLQSHELIGLCQNMLSSIVNNDDEEALQTLSMLQGKYDRYSLFWQTTIEHGTIEQVSEHISRLENDLIYGVVFMARRDCALLIEALEGINKNLWPHFGNVL